MDLARLEDVIQRGLGRAGRAVGGWCEAYRPRGPEAALHPRNLVLRLQAAFALPDGGFGRTPAHGQVLWRGLFDAAYTRPGDYLLRREQRRGAADGGVWFILAQPRMLPVLCARATRVATFLRRGGPAVPGECDYGGGQAPDTVLLRDWPASVVLAGGDGTGEAGLPDDTRGASWTVLLPALGGVVLRAGDVMRDDLGQAGVVAAAELSDLGWRLRVRQAAS